MKTKAIIVVLLISCFSVCYAWYFGYIGTRQVSCILVSEDGDLNVPTVSLELNGHPATYRCVVTNTLGQLQTGIMTDISPTTICWSQCPGLDYCVRAKGDAGTINCSYVCVIKANQSNKKDIRIPCSQNSATFQAIDAENFDPDLYDIM